MSYFSTLGYSPNLLLEKYTYAFLLKIQHLWKSHISEDIPSRDFLLSPDIHGSLLAGIRQGNPSKNEIFDYLRQEYLSFKKRGNNFPYVVEEIIDGTHIVLTLDFHNLSIENQAHPHHKENKIGVTFGSKTPSEWNSLFALSFDIVRKVSPGFMSEIDTMIHKILPFDVSSGVHNSGSYSDHIGHLLMSYPVDIEYPEIALLEAILHEYNHNKLNLILQTENLVLNDRRELYYSPYRPDARHIHGIYLGLHAIAGAYWVVWNAYSSGIIQLSDIWLEKAVLYVLKNGLSLQVLDKYAELTPLGREFFEEMRNVHQECLKYIKDANISPDIISRAKKSLILHFENVKQNYPYVLF